MEIKTDKIEAMFSFSPKDYFLVHSKDDRFPNAVGGDNKPLMAWTLNPKIDMSYKGKDPQVAVATIYIDKDEAEKLKKYFVSIEM